MNGRSLVSSLRLSAALLLAGQILYIVVTQFHADGPANNHPVVFAEYASSGSWTAVHFAQFGAMAILLAGVFGLFFVVDGEDGVARWTGRFGAGLAVAALALYGVLQAVDGVANKQADLAWVNAGATDKAAFFAGAEAIRWIEWGMRSYQNFVLGTALVLFAVAVVRTAWLPTLVGYLIGLAGLVYWVQGWVVGSEGFSQTMSTWIIIGWAIDVVWMIWLVVVAWRFTSEAPMARALAAEA